MLPWLERNQLLVLGVAIVLSASGLAAASLAGDGSPAAVEFHDGSGLAPGTAIKVHVAGAVLAPGVHELREGDRLADALAAAGGPAEDADLDAVNLARRVRDEEQIVVPRRAGAGRLVEALAPGESVDINSASEALLDQLPGIGEAYSRRIVDSRRLDGPYKSTEELVERRVLPRAVYERVRGQLVAGP